MYSKKRYVYLDKDAFNEKLKIAKEAYHLVYRAPEYKERLGLKAFLEDRMVQVVLTFREFTASGYKAVSYVFFKDGRNETQKISGVDAYATLKKYTNIDEKKSKISASPFLYKNEKYEGTRNKAIGYALNSAYSWAMIQDMPDTTKMQKAGIVKNDEIGFDLITGERILPGNKAPVIFKLMESPFKKFVAHWYNIKKNPKTPEEKKKAKNMLNFSVGYLQRKNPYLRAQIIGICNDYMRSLIDENTLYCNTDSLVSLVPRPDLELGNGLGQWKIEHQGQFAYRGFNYQWDKDVSYRGIPKSWFKEDFDILVDELPICGNMYEYNSELNKVVLNGK